MEAAARVLLSHDARVNARWSLHYRSRWWDDTDFPELFVLKEGLSLTVWRLAEGETAKVLKIVASVSLPYVSLGSVCSLLC
jgi:hypothetical protein